MTRIKITQANAAKIEAALAAGNGKSAAHCYTTYAEVEAVSNRLTRRLSGYSINQIDRSGAVITSSSGSVMPHCYKGMRNATRITIERGSKDNFLVDVAACTLWPNQAGGEVITLTNEQAKIAMDRLAETFITPQFNYFRVM